MLVHGNSLAKTLYYDNIDKYNWSLYFDGQEYIIYNPAAIYIFGKILYLVYNFQDQTSKTYQPHAIYLEELSTLCRIKISNIKFQFISVEFKLSE